MSTNAKISSDGIDCTCVSCSNKSYFCLNNEGSCLHSTLISIVDFFNAINQSSNTDNIRSINKIKIIESSQNFDKVLSCMIKTLNQKFKEANSKINEVANFKINLTEIITSSIPEVGSAIKVLGEAIKAKEKICNELAKLFVDCEAENKYLKEKLNKKEREYEEYIKTSLDKFESLIQEFLKVKSELNEKIANLERKLSEKTKELSDFQTKMRDIEEVERILENLKEEAEKEKIKNARKGKPN